MQVHQGRHGNVSRWMWLTISILVFSLSVAISSQEDSDSDDMARMLNDGRQLARFSAIHGKKKPSEEMDSESNLNQKDASGQDYDEHDHDKYSYSEQDSAETRPCHQNKNCINGHKCKKNDDCMSGVCEKKKCKESAISTRQQACCTLMCDNGGTCWDPPGPVAPTCNCTVGWTGPFCDIPNTIAITTATPGILPGQRCQTNVCLNGGTCILASSGSGFLCTCSSGYAGLLCEATVSVVSPGQRCQTNVCLNGGTCILASSGSGFLCTCSSGYTGLACELSASGILPGQRCQTNVCLNGGTCTIASSGGGFFCTCSSGYAGLSCESSVSSSSDCNDGSNPCGLDSEYYNPANGYQCIQSGPNSVVCTCPGGYEIDRPCRVCSRSNPLQNACRNDTGRLAACLESDSLGTGYVCLCLNSQTQIPEPTPHPNCGEPFTPLTNTSTNTTAQLLCENGGVSIGNTCKCPSGYSGTLCNQNQRDDLCRNIICKNRGNCAIQNPNGSYESVCNCRASFSGAYCEIQGTSGFCSPSSCWNGAVCREVVFGATRTAYCDCLLGYRGIKCDNRYFSCPAAGKFRDEEMHEQGKYFECSNMVGGLRLERRSCAKGLRFNTGTQACTD